MNIRIIVAVDSDMAIGRKGDLIYRISEDLRRFKALTTGHPIIMGRRTFESFPKGPLPGRTNIVITHRPDYSVPDGVLTAGSLEQALALAAKAPGSDDAFIIGGAQIYAIALPVATHLHLTRIADSTPDADTYFPTIAPDEWHTVATEPSATDSRVTYQTLARRPLRIR